MQLQYHIVLCVPTAISQSLCKMEFLEVIRWGISSRQCVLSSSTDLCEVVSTILSANQHKIVHFKQYLSIWYLALLIYISPFQFFIELAFENLQLC